MADAITPAVQEMEESLKNIDKVLSSSAKETFLLKQELLQINKILSTKNWEILSRFLSGTGAWRVLNKFKASVLMMVQLASVKERASLAEAERMQKIAQVAKDRNDLLKLEIAMTKAKLRGDKESLDVLREMSDTFAGFEMVYGIEEAFDRITTKIKKQRTIMGSLLDAVTGKQKVKIPKFETIKMLHDRRRHMENLNTSKNNSLLIAAGLGINLQQLLKISKSSTAMAEIAKANQKYDEEFDARFMKAQNEETQAILKWHETKKKVEDWGGVSADIGNEPFPMDKQLMNNIVQLEMSEEGMNRPTVEDADIGKVQAILDTIKSHSNIYEMAGDLTGKTADLMKEGLIGFYEVSDALSFKQLEAAELNLEVIRQQSGLVHIQNKAIERMQNSNIGMVKDLGDRIGLKDEDENFEDTGFGLFKKEMGKVPKIDKLFMKYMNKVMKFVKLAGSFLIKALYYFTIIVLSLFLLYRVFKALEPTFKDLWNVLEAGFVGIQLALSLVWLGLQNIYEGFLKGDLFQVVGGLFQIGIGMVVFLLTVILTAAALFWVALFSFIGRWLGELKAGGQDTVKAIRNMAFLIGAAILVVAILMASWPVALAGIIVIALGAVVNSIGSYLGGIFGFADGGITKNGLSLVGEKGPELVRLPTGSRVYSNANSQKMLTSGEGITNNITVQVTGRVGASDTEIRDIATKVSREINLRMNRTSSTVSGF